ncbi:MAG: hypothetical protein B6D65_01510 [candidate division Zixibacteria bacterium 4484_93]|nr:MAG: hypothetical protein B6D65_01510 [candidate division Zixibacteria bacterium 4484_93]
MKRYILILFLLLLSCSNKEEPVARVDETILTEDELSQMVGYSSEVLSSGYVKDAVNSWIDQELLYREARKRKLDRREDIKQEIEEYSRYILTEHLIQEVVLDGLEIEEDSLLDYYNRNSSLYTAQNDMVRLILLSIEDADTASSVHEKITNGVPIGRFEPFLYLSDSSGSFFTRDELPKEVAKVAFSMGDGKLSEPIETSFGYFIIKKISSVKQGVILPFEAVRDDIHYILYSRKSSDRISSFIDSLRGEHSIWINPSYEETTDVEEDSI